MRQHTQFSSSMFIGLQSHKHSLAMHFLGQKGPSRSRTRFTRQFNGFINYQHQPKQQSGKQFVGAPRQQKEVVHVTGEATITTGAVNTTIGNATLTTTTSLNFRKLLCVSTGILLAALAEAEIVETTVSVLSGMLALLSTWHHAKQCPKALNTSVLPSHDVVKPCTCKDRSSPVMP